MNDSAPMFNLADVECRTDTDDLFKISGIFNGRKLQHEFFLVFNGTQVRSLRNSAELLTFPDDCWVLTQWPGNWRSDLFKFQVGDYRAWVKENHAGN